MDFRDAMVIVAANGKANDTGGTAVDHPILVLNGSIGKIGLERFYVYGRRLLCKGSTGSDDQDQASQKYKLFRLHERLTDV
jgi:hypothetical protein